MRIIESRRGYFYGTHKGATIEIEHSPRGCSKYYITVRAENGGMLYAGWAPASVTTMAAAKREAKRGSLLDGKASGVQAHA